MSDFVEPSAGTAESFQHAGSNRYAAAPASGVDWGWVADTNTNYYAAEAGATGTPLDAFNHSATSGHTVTIDTGEAFVAGKWLARDVTTDYTLASGTNNQTLYVGWPAGTGDSITIGKSADFAANHGKAPIWQFDTDSSTVTSTTDLRKISPQQRLRIENRTDRPSSPSLGRVIYRTDKD